MDQAALIDIARGLLLNKWYITGMNFLWVYDYFLTLGDEVAYGWPGRKSWIFMLFLAIRYSPVLYILWVNFAIFHYTDSFCKATKWVAGWSVSTVTVLAQITVAIRIYAITGKNRLCGGALSVIIIAQLLYGAYLTISTGLGPISPLLELNLPGFKSCFAAQLQIGGFVFTGIEVVFDILAFSIIVVRARRASMIFPGIPTLLDTIRRDATVYFVLISISQLCVLFFLIFAPLSIKGDPTAANAILIPIMASRLILSLKKAHFDSTEPRSLETISALDRGGPREVGTISFPPRTPCVNPRISGTLNQSPLISDVGDFELQSMQ